MARQSTTREVASTAAPEEVQQDAEVVVEPDPPVYDERGNVRPKGTPGAVPMTYAQRVAIAKKLGNGARIVTTVEVDRTDAEADRDPDAPEAA